MNVEISNKVDKKTQAARLMSVIQHLMMGTEVTITISPDVPMNEVDEIFQKTAEFAALSWSMIKPKEEEESDEWKDSD